MPNLLFLKKWQTLNVRLLQIIGGALRVIYMLQNVAPLLALSRETFRT